MVIPFEAIADNNNEGRRCSGCGKAEVPGYRELPWMIPTRLEEYPHDYYCESCYQGFRLYESTEEQIISALKAADVHTTYTMEHLLKALEELASTSPEALAEAFERGTTSALQRVAPEKAAS